MNGNGALRSLRVRPLAAVAGLAVALSAGAALATPVTGSLTVDGLRPATTDVRARYWEEWNGAVPPRAHRIDVGQHVTVVLTGPGTPEAFEYRFSGGTLETETVVVPAGAKFALVNTDILDHQLTAPGVPELAPILTGAGQTRSVAAPAPGTYELSDLLQPHTVGHLVVLKDAIARASVNARGEWTFPDVPQGEYRLRVYAEGREVHSRDVSVSGTRMVNVGSLRVRISGATR